LKDKIWVKRSASASALGQIKSEKSVQALIELLHDEDARVRRSVVLSLQNIGSTEAVPALTQALKDEDFEVRMYAAEALKAIDIQGEDESFK
jgi:HEAT repeat protein